MQGNDEVKAIIVKYIYIPLLKKTRIARRRNLDLKFPVSVTVSL